MLKIDRIAVLVQGPVIDTRYGSTHRNLRELVALGFGEIVFSTWDGQKLDDIPEGIIVVVSNDPGSNLIRGGQSNVNRQIVSTRAGLEKVTLDHVLRLRSDTTIQNFPLESCLNFSDKEKIFLTNITTKLPPRVDYFFHYSDWLIFARKSRMECIFNIELQNSKSDLCAEQFIWSSYARSIYPEITDEERLHEAFNNDITLISFRKFQLKSIKRAYRRIPFGKNGIRGVLCVELEKKSKFWIGLLRFKEYIYFLVIFIALRLKNRW